LNGKKRVLKLSEELIKDVIYIKYITNSIIIVEYDWVYLAKNSPLSGIYCSMTFFIGLLIILTVINKRAHCNDIGPKTKQR